MSHDRLLLILWQIGAAMTVYLVSVILGIVAALLIEDQEVLMAITVAIACCCWLALFCMWRGLGPTSAVGKSACVIAAGLVGLDVMFAIASAS